MLAGPAPARVTSETTCSVTWGLAVPACTVQCRMEQQCSEVTFGYLKVFPPASLANSTCLQVLYY